ncbi:hypothetical protein ACFWTE_23715 [Nocardiopsis sp. NPDC058631]|uniref:hypothetical protein n=1 Tax=Nocardiopsis sp. NPDC058631 TaxID=3346566 RepID=UPI0036679C6E
MAEEPEKKRKSRKKRDGEEREGTNWMRLFAEVLVRQASRAFIEYMFGGGSGSDSGDEGALRGDDD